MGVVNDFPISGVIISEHVSGLMGLMNGDASQKDNTLRNIQQWCERAER